VQLESEPEPVVEEKEEEKEEEVLAATMTKVFLKPKEIDDKDLLYFKFKFTFKVQNKKGKSPMKANVQILRYAKNRIFAKNSDFCNRMSYTFDISNLDYFILQNSCGLYFLLKI